MFSIVLRRVSFIILHGAVESVMRVNIKTHTADVGVSVDGTCQRKGFTILNGVITAVSVDRGKVLDTVLLSKKCTRCTKMQAIKAIDPQA